MQTSNKFHKYLVFIISIVCVGTFLFVLKNRYEMPLSEEEIRIRRQSATQNSFPKTRERIHQPYYYEEQRPVLVHAENYVNNVDPSTLTANYDDAQHYVDKDRNYDFDYEQLIGATEQRQMEETEESAPVIKPSATKSTFEVLMSVARDFKAMYDIYKAFSNALSSTPVSNETTAVIHPTVTLSDAERERRQSTDLSESARYIKGDPLKGYYDFVITEGSYKFWAVFQVGTAILIIYSTFAAIYYSKVNPLTSDYDYTDYLGGARAFNGENLDFVDPTEDNHMQTTNNEDNKEQNSWYNTLLPKIGKSLQVVLETIDKLNEFEEQPKLYDKLLEKNQQVVYS